MRLEKQARPSNSSIFLPDDAVRNSASATSNPSAATPSVAPLHATMMPLQAAILKFSELACPLSIVGEPGSGKRTVARWIHRSSARRHESFCEIDSLEFSTALSARRAKQVQTAADTAYFSDASALSPLAVMRSLVAVGKEELVLAAPRDSDRSTAFTEVQGPKGTRSEVQPRLHRSQPKARRERLAVSNRGGDNTRL